MRGKYENWDKIIERITVDIGCWTLTLSRTIQLLISLVHFALQLTLAFLPLQLRRRCSKHCSIIVGSERCKWQSGDGWCWRCCYCCPVSLLRLNTVNSDTQLYFYLPFLPAAWWALTIGSLQSPLELQTIHRFSKSQAFSWLKAPTSTFTLKTLC